MTHREIRRKFKGVTRHEKPLRDPKPTPKRDPFRRVRKVLLALVSGKRLLYDKKAKRWLLEGERKLDHVKARVVEHLQAVGAIRWNVTRKAWAMTAEGHATLAAIGVRP